MKYLKQKKLVESYIADITDLELSIIEHGSSRSAERKLKKLKAKMQEESKKLRDLDNIINN